MSNQLNGEVVVGPFEDRPGFPGWLQATIFYRPLAAAPPVASFTGTPTSGTDPLTVAFTDASSNTPTSWLWERDSGSGWSTFSTSQNPTQSFTAGTWSVRLTATNAGGSDTQTRTSYLVIAAAGIALVAHSAAGSVGGNTVTTAGIDTTGANLLVAAVAGYSAVTLPVPTDSRGSTITGRTVRSGGSARMQQSDGAPASVGAGHTATEATSAAYPTLAFAAFAGAAASPLDQQSGTGGTGVTSLQPGSITPSVPGCLFLAAVCFNSTNTVSVTGTGWVMLDQFNYFAGQCFGLAIAYKIQTGGVAAENPTFSWATPCDAAVSMCAYKPA